MEKHSKEQETNIKQPKRPFTKSDFEAVLKAATKPPRKEQAKKEPEET